MAEFQEQLTWPHDCLGCISTCDKTQRFQVGLGTYRAVTRLASFVTETIEVADAVIELEHLPAALEDVALGAAWFGCLDQRIFEGDKDVCGLGTRKRNVVGFQDVGSDDGKVSDDVLDGADDGVGAARADENLPLDVHNGVVARGALDGVVCKVQCLRLGLVPIFGWVCPPIDPLEMCTHSEGNRGAHQEGDDEVKVEVLHDEGLLIDVGKIVVVDCFSRVEELSKEG